MLFLPTCQNKQLSYIQIITNQKIIISELFKLSETCSKVITLWWLNQARFGVKYKLRQVKWAHACNYQYNCFWKANTCMVLFKFTDRRSVPVFKIHHRLWHTTKTDSIAISSQPTIEVFSVRNYKKIIPDLSEVYLRGISGLHGEAI